jgi:hypothetical protein
MLYLDSSNKLKQKGEKPGPSFRLLMQVCVFALQQTNNKTAQLKVEISVPNNF